MGKTAVRSYFILPFGIVGKAASLISVENGFKNFHLGRFAENSVETEFLKAGAAVREVSKYFRFAV